MEQVLQNTFCTLAEDPDFKTPSQSPQNESERLFGYSWLLSVVLPLVLGFCLLCYVACEVLVLH